MVQDLAVGRAEHRPDEQARREDPAGAADPDRQAGRDHLADEQHDQESDGVLPVDAVPEDGVADPIHLRKQEQHPAEQHPADGGTQPFRAVGSQPGPVAGVLDPVEHPGEDHSDEAGDQAEESEQQVLAHVMHAEGGQVQERLVAERGPPDNTRGDRGEHDHAEGLGGEVGQDQFHGEEHAGQRGVERCRDPAGGAAGDQHPHPRLGDSHYPADARAEGGADLHDRPLAADGSAAADAQR